MFTEHKSVFLFVDCLWSRAPGGGGEGGGGEGGEGEGGEGGGV